MIQVSPKLVHISEYCLQNPGAAPDVISVHNLKLQLEAVGEAIPHFVGLFKASDSA